MLTFMAEPKQEPTEMGEKHGNKPPVTELYPPELAAARRKAGRGHGTNGNLRPPWKPGETANLGGSPRARGLARAVREIPAELGLGDGDLLLARIFWRIVGDPNTKTADVIAAGRWLAERGWGKPAEFVPIEDGDPLGAALSDETVDDLGAQLAMLREKRAERERAEVA
jgi:hypothetical protein